MRTFQNGPYRVQMGMDGAILVRPGDWLSKISAAVYGDYFQWNKFGRPDGPKRLKAIKNPNLIYAGETIYHGQTWFDYHQRNAVFDDSEAIIALG